MSSSRIHCCYIIPESESESHSGVSDSLQPHGLYSPWNSPSQNTGVGSLSLLQEIFSTQGWNPGLPHRRWILYQLSCKESPRILEWVAYPFSSGSSRPRNRTGGSCIASRFFTNWAMTTEFKLSCVIISFRLKEKKRKMFYVTKTKECREKKVCPLLFFEKPRPLSPQRPLDFLSTCLGIDSLSLYILQGLY